MKCPKCGYTSFDYLMECKKCGEILEDCRRALNLRMNEPTIFTNLEEEEPTYSHEDDLRIAESLGDSDIAQESIILGDFQPPIDDTIVDTTADIPETAAEAAGELENEMQMDDFELELDTLTPLAETGTGKTDDIAFDGFSGDRDASKESDPFATASGKSPGETDLLESNNLVGGADSLSEATGDGFSLDLEPPLDLSSTDSLQVESPAIVEGDDPAGGGVVELNLDDDDESLDKILAELEDGDDLK